MTLWTWSDIKAKVQADLDLTDEIMIDEDELLGYANQAIEEAEQLIGTLYKDYLLQTTSLALVNGQADYDFPSNIYAHKVRKIIYDDGSTKYEIKRMRDLSEIPYVDSQDFYRYVPYMNSSGSFKMKLYPASRESSSSNVTVWFIGRANRMTVDADILNLPDPAPYYVIARTKLECARKEGHPSQATLEQEVMKQEKLLTDTLASMTPDEDNRILLDTSWHDDFGNDWPHGAGSRW